MTMKTFKRSSAIYLLFIAFPAIVFAETVGIFYNTSVEQIKFAANDIKVTK